MVSYRAHRRRAGHGQRYMCRGYVQVLYQVKDPASEAVADDVATVGLEMLLAQDSCKHGGHNPFLLGH